MAKDQTPALKDRPADVLAELAKHAKGEALARLVHTVAFSAADERRASLSDGVLEVAERAGISSEDAETSFGNVLRALERGGGEAAGSATRVLLSALLAKGVAVEPPARERDAEARVVEALVWLAANTSIDALMALDAAMGDKAGPLWVALGRLVRRVDEGQAPQLGRSGGLIAALALRESESEAAQGEVEALRTDVRDPIVRSILGEGGGAAAPLDPVSASGELVAAPRGPVALALLGISGILILMHVVRLIGRLTLRYRRPAELRISAKGITVRSKTELLGKTLAERETHIPIEAVARATREVKYPRLAMYTGLFSLALGSYLGLSLFVDGARAGSPELLGIGLLLVVLGVAIDFILENAKSSAQGRCRVVIVPRKGPVLALGGVDPKGADAALGRLSVRT